MKRWMPAIVIMIGLFIFSSIPNLQIVDESILSPAARKFVSQYYIEYGEGGFFSYAASLHPDFILHKLGHIFGYGFLGIAIFFATRGSVTWSMAIVALFALSDELHQYFTEGRSSRFGDVILDIVAAFVFIYIFKWFQTKKVEGGKI